MIIMPVPKDVRNFKPKFIGPLTKRQFLSLVPAGIIAALMLWLFSGLLPRDIVIFLIVIIDIPIVACGFIDVYGMPLQVFMKDYIYSKLFFPTNRVYKTKNVYEKYAKQNKITYAYFDGDTTTYTGKNLKLKEREYRKRLERYLRENPEMKPID